MEDDPKLYCPAYWATVEVITTKPKDILLPMSSQEKNLGKKPLFKWPAKGGVKVRRGAVEKRDTSSINIGV